MKKPYRELGRKLLPAEPGEQPSRHRLPRLRVLRFIWDIPESKPQEVKRIWP